MKSHHNKFLNWVSYRPYMQSHSPDDTFKVTFSKWKVWALTAVMWGAASVPLALLVFLIWNIIPDGQNLDPLILSIFIFLFIMFAFFAALPFIFLRRINGYLAILTRDGFAGSKFLRNHSQSWTPETFLYYSGGVTIIANPEASQSWMSRLWVGPRTAIILHSPLAKQSHAEVLEALNRLNPYVINETTLWEQSKRFP